MDDELIDLGPLTYRLECGALRDLRWHGVEVLRGLSAPVRDVSWGTVREERASWRHEIGPAAAAHDRRFRIGDGALCCHLRIEASAGGRLSAEVTMTAARDYRTNRAGFCLLHPLSGVTGTAFTARGASGTERTGRFPEAISPAQPATDLTALSHVVHGVRVRIEMEGEIFEMEDQRNWSDASFKTYCRPLSRPLPQRIAAGETVRQRIDIRLDGEGVVPAAGTGAGAAVRIPEVLVALEPAWLPAGAIPGNAALLRWGPGAEWSARGLDRVRDVLNGRPLDLELVLPDGMDGAAAAARSLARAGLAPRHVAPLPAPYLASHQPDGPWPDGPAPEDAMAAAAEAFPHARIGAGMLTNFTELNRRPVRGGAYITHGNAAIVHAADDRSVLETLEALPTVFASARTLAGTRSYRLGLVAIGMRSNLYGQALALNPAGERMTLTDSDPRQGTPFAAAYAVAVCALAARAGAEAVALAAAAGPLGAEGRPIGTAIAALAALAGEDAMIEGAPPGPLRIRAGARTITLGAPGAAPVLKGFTR